MIRMRSIAGAMALSICLCTSPAQAQYVHTRGQDVLDGSGKKLQLQGTNLGNWLVREGYMWGMQGEGSPTSGSEIDRFLREMIGPSRTDAFWKQWEDTYITHDDIKLIKTAGFNSIRVPLDYKYFDGNDARGFEIMDRLRLDRLRVCGMVPLSTILGGREAIAVGPTLAQTPRL